MAHEGRAGALNILQGAEALEDVGLDLGKLGKHLLLGQVVGILFAKQNTCRRKLRCLGKKGGSIRPSPGQTINLEELMRYMMSPMLSLIMLSVILLSLCDVLSTASLAWS